MTEVVTPSPRYSILVAAFNVAATIERCIDSIVAARQGYDVELIVLDDGSSDRTAEICAGYAATYPWIRLLTQLNAGISEVRNRLLREATGRYLAFVDGDDAIESRYFDVVDEQLRETTADMVVFGHNRQWLDGTVLSKQNVRADLARADLARLQLRIAENASLYMLCWARVFKREMSTGFVFDRRIRLGEDTAFNIHLMNRAARVAVVPDCLYNHFETPGSLSSGAYKPALLDSFEAHYRARLRVHAWPPAGTADWVTLKQSIALTYVEYVLLYLLNNVRHLPLREQWGDLRRIRDSVIYQDCIPHYVGRSPYRGTRHLVDSFIKDRYLMILLGLWSAGLLSKIRLSNSRPAEVGSTRERRTHFLQSPTRAKKRVLIVADWINLTGGVTRTLLELLKQLDPREFETTLYVLRPAQSDLTVVPAHIHVIENRYDLPYLGARRAFLQLLSQRKVLDALGCLAAVAKLKLGGNRVAYTRFFVKRHPRVSETFHVAAAYAMLDSYSNQFVAERIDASRKIMWCHTDTALYSERVLEGLGQVFVQFDAINCVSRDTMLALHGEFPELDARLRVRYNLMDEERIKRLSTEPAPLLLESLPANVTVLATVARISPEKGIDLLVGAAERLRDAGHRFLWWVVGPEFNPEFAAEVKARCIDSGMEEYVRFVGGQDNPYPYLASCDIYVQTSRIEGFCTSTAEAKVLNLPVVCTNTSGAEEQFESGVNGSIVAPTVDDLFAEVARLIESPGIRESYREALRAQSRASEQSAAAFFE